MKKPKSTTKGGRRGRTRRNRTKYSALDRSKNLPSRKDYIEVEYINGVVDEDGNTVIRPLNKEEKEFLNKFYEETIVTNFTHNPEIKRLTKLRREMIEDDNVNLIRQEIKQLKEDEQKNKDRLKELKEVLKLTKKQNMEKYYDKIVHIENELNELREKHLLHPNKDQHKEFYNQNNSRNSCIFNKKKTERRLDQLDYEIYNNEYRCDSINYEDNLIDELDSEHWEKEIERLMSIMPNKKKDE